MDCIHRIKRNSIKTVLLMLDIFTMTSMLNMLAKNFRKTLRFE